MKLNVGILSSSKMWFSITESIILSRSNKGIVSSVSSKLKSIVFLLWKTNTSSYVLNFQDISFLEKENGRQICRKASPDEGRSEGEMGRVKGNQSEGFCD
jgi:hypothetical protein